MLTAGQMKPREEVSLSSLSVFSSEFVSQHPIFGLKLSEARSNRRKSRLNLRLGKARCDVLRTIPVKRFEMEEKSALGLGSIGHHRQRSSELRIDLQLLYFDSCIDFESAPVWIVHDKQRRTVVC